MFSSHEMAIYCLETVFKEDLLVRTLSLLYKWLLDLGIVGMNFSFCSLNMRACFAFGVS